MLNGKLGALSELNTALVQEGYFYEQELTEAVRTIEYRNGNKVLYVRMVKEATKGVELPAYNSRNGFRVQITTTGTPAVYRIMEAF